MNSLLFILLQGVYDFDFNITNFTSNWLVYAFSPYASIFGNAMWGIIFGFMGAGIYAGSRSGPTVFTFLIIVGLIFSIILPEALIAIFVMVVTLIGTSALYVVYVTKKGDQ